jgi:outer membrane protein assembly factor BamB
MRPSGVGRTLALAVALASAACRASDVLTEACRAPEIVASAILPLTQNVLGLVVHVNVRGADSVGVQYGLAGTAPDSVAPTVTAIANSAAVPVLGLLPSTDYRLRPITYNRCGTSTGDELRYTTGALPADLPSYRASGADPSPGFVAFASSPYGLVIDNTGRIVWYHRFPDGSGLNFQVTANGHYVARPPASGTEPLRWIVIDPLGALVTTLGCARALTPRFHDFLMESDGSYWTMCDEVRAMDLSAIGGHADARVMGTLIQHLSSAGALLFEWSPFDHFALTDLPDSERERRDVNWTHGNAFDLDDEGNLIVSFRNLNEITKIDTRTGAVVWRMGGLANEFTWNGTPLPAFAGQHGLRATGHNEFLILDNLGHADGSRAERYGYNEGEHAVRLWRSYGVGAGVIAQVGGTTQSLPGGRALVAFGNGGRLIEYDAEGSVVWRIEGDAGYVFRAQRIQSLYRPGVGSAR